MNDHKAAGWCQGAAREEFRRLLQSRAKAYGLTLAAIDVLVTRAETVVYPRPGHVICRSDEPTDYVRFVVQGLVETRCVCAGGRVLAVRFISPGHFVCLPPGLGAGGYHLEAVAHAPTTVALLARAHIREAIGALSADGVTKLVSWAWRNEAGFLHEKLVLLTLRVPERVEQELRSLARSVGRPWRDGVLIDVALTELHLAELVGATRANVSRTMARLRRTGALDRVGNRLVLSARFLASAAPWRAPAAAARALDHMNPAPRVPSGTPPGSGLHPSRVRVLESR